MVKFIEENQEHSKFMTLMKWQIYRVNLMRATSVSKDVVILETSSCVSKSGTYMDLCKFILSLGSIEEAKDVHHEE